MNSQFDIRTFSAENIKIMQQNRKQNAATLLFEDIAAFIFSYVMSSSLHKNYYNISIENEDCNVITTMCEMMTSKGFKVVLDNSRGGYNITISWQ
jgi:hypothetical protein